MARARRAATRLLDAVHSVLARGDVFEIGGARTLVFAPHPDDEVLGCGGTVLLKTRSGSEVGIVFMTDGAASHAGLMPRQDLVARRRLEAMLATSLLGVPAERVTFLDLPDEQLALHRADAVLRVRGLLESLAPDEVLVPHAADRLPDHAATYEIVMEALRVMRRPVRILEFPVWLWHAWPWTPGRPYGSAGAVAALLGRARDIWHLTAGCRVTADIRPVLQLKSVALEAHKSQVERLDGNPRWPVLADVADGEFLSCFFNGTERFRGSWHRPERT